MVVSQLKVERCHSCVIVQIAGEKPTATDCEHCKDAAMDILEPFELKPEPEYVQQSQRLTLAQV